MWIVVTHTYSYRSVGLLSVKTHKYGHITCTQQVQHLFWVILHSLLWWNWLNSKSTQTVCPEKVREKERDQERKKPAKKWTPLVKFFWRELKKHKKITLSSGFGALVPGFKFKFLPLCVYIHTTCYLSLYRINVFTHSLTLLLSLTHTTPDLSSPTCRRHPSPPPSPVSGLRGDGGFSVEIYSHVFLFLIEKIR